MCTAESREHHHLLYDSRMQQAVSVTGVLLSKVLHVRFARGRFGHGKSGMDH